MNCGRQWLAAGCAGTLISALRCGVQSPRARPLNRRCNWLKTQGSEQVDTSHLIAAIIALTDYHEEDFGALKLDRARWGAAFVQHITSLQRDRSSLQFWRRFYTRRFPGQELRDLTAIRGTNHRPDYDADAYTRVDLLEIDDQVSALAYVIAAKQTQPPLAIGLFGEWGSGKTFFMKHLRRRVAELATGARAQNASERTCRANIAQIEFNAWHYQEGDLWASLVDHILRNLRFGENETEASLAGRRTEFIKQLEAIESKQKAATERVEAATDRVESAEQRVSVLRAQEETCRQQLASQLLSGRSLKALRAGVTLAPEVKSDIEALSDELKLTTLRANAADMAEAVGEARRELHSMWAFLVPLVRGQDRGRRWLLLGCALLVPIAVAYLVNLVMSHTGWIARLTSAVSGLVAFLTAATAWIRSQSRWLGHLRDRVGRVSSAFDAEVEKELAQQKQQIVHTLQTIEDVKEQRNRAQLERNEAETQAAAIKTQLRALDDEGLMRAFLDSRLGGGAYQQKLGTAALVRRDFERLSRQIVEVTQREEAGTLEPDELVINRIVLYIDDLDRCDMSRAVPVLRAVHLLLAFEAFVVVVGVDSRWVARCLEKHHEEIFADAEGAGTRRVTPLDYLEKIFQIPIWLREIAPDDRVSMVRKLFRKDVESPSEPDPRPEQTERPPRTAAASEETNTAARDSSTTPKPHDRSPASGDRAPPARPKSSHDEKKAQTLDLNPSGLEITDGEYEFLGELAALLSPSPRAIKQL